MIAEEPRLLDLCVARARTPHQTEGHRAAPSRKGVVPTWHSLLTCGLAQLEANGSAPRRKPEPAIGGSAAHGSRLRQLDWLHIVMNTVLAANRGMTDVRHGSHFRKAALVCASRASLTVDPFPEAATPLMPSSLTPSWWQAIASGHVFIAMTREESDARREVLEEMAVGLTSDGSALDQWFNEVTRPKFIH
jgi:hypothetical protein